jgi:pSer/pThr/pTyr-binding forkhead associated (FHA) protein
VNRPSLKVLEGGAAGQSIPLGDGPFVIGRGESEQGRLGDDPELSRRHARIEVRDGQLIIEDLGSTNGTRVNGRLVERSTPLNPGDSIEVGTTKLEVVAPEPDVTVPRRVEKPPQVGDRVNALLEVMSGPAAGTRVPVADEAFAIGRAEEGPGKLGDDAALSRRHAKIYLVDDRLVVEDVDSTHGTYVNGRRIVYPTVIQPGDRIDVGDTTLEVMEAPTETPSRASSAAINAIQTVREAETGLLGKFADVSSRYSARILGATAIFFVVAVILGAPTPTLLPSHPSPDPNVESSLAEDEIKEAGGTNLGVGLIALIRSDAPVRSAETRAKARRVIDRIKREPAVARVIDFYSTGQRGFVSKDGTDTYVGAVFKDVGEDETDTAAESIQADIEKVPGVLAGGETLTGPAVGDQAGEDLGKAEGMAFPILFIASLFVFRGVIAALLPLYVGIITVFASFLALRLVNDAITDVSLFALNLVIALGLGLAIDYSLFIVSRYREEMVKHGPGAKALSITLQTAGRTVLFSALTVAAALGSLLVFPQSFVYSMGIGGIICSLIAVTVALVALPALLAALGPRVNALAPKRWRDAAERTARQEQSGFWYRISRFVMRRPLPVAIASAALLLLMGLPFLGIKFTGFDASVLPETSNVRKVDDALKADFPQNRGRQINLAISAPPTGARDVQAYAAELRSLRGVAAVEPPRRLNPEIWQLNVIPRYSDLDDRTLDLVREIRDRSSPFPAKVAGPAAAFIDQQASLGDNLPLALGILAVVTVIILFAMTGSIVLPLKSLLMNVLTVSAAFGLLVLIFQDGRLEGLLSYQSQGGIESTQPLLLFVLAFGLSTDYAVFLLTRIKEARESGLSETESVAVGLERTGRIVTAAALLFCIAIGAFATSQIIFIKQLGLGTAFAVLIDATIVRALLVPSLMAMLGHRNWWAPGPLRRLHARFGISEA